MQHHSRDSPKINKISLEKNLCTLLTCITLTTDHKGPQHTRHWSEISPFSQVPCISQLHPVKKSINEYCKDVSSPVIQMQHNYFKCKFPCINNYYIETQPNIDISCKKPSKIFGFSRY